MSTLLHAHTHTHHGHLDLLWAGRTGEMGPFQDASHNLPLWYSMDGGAEYECANVIVCLFVCERE